MISVVIPSRTDRYVDRILGSLEASQAGSSSRAIVGDNGLDRPAVSARWPRTKFVDVPRDPFVFSKAINLCVAAAPEEDDLLIMGDDSVVESSGWLDVAQGLLDQHQGHGMISPRVIGSIGNREQQECAPGVLKPSDGGLCFVAVLVRRRAWQDVGPMDERFVGYGFDDIDYCTRMGLSGWLMAITGDVVVRHGVDGYASSATYLKHYPGEIDRMCALNVRLFNEKWGK